ncbi:MAG: Tll0287-like domain-containing protein [Nitrospiraceae bacterium]
MGRKRFVWAALGLLITVSSYWSTLSGTEGASAQTESQIAISAETVADYLHAVIEADRTFYTIHVVERMQAKGIVVASENWLSANTLPLPAQFLMESARLSSMTGTKIGYRLISAWPINEQNRPKTKFERAGFGDVLAKPDQAYTGTVTDGQDRYFQAIYADRAVSQACIGCHNAHPSSPKRNFKMHDVMGAMVITIPLGR